MANIKGKAPAIKKTPAQNEVEPVKENKTPAAPAMPKFVSLSLILGIENDTNKKIGTIDSIRPIVKTNDMTRNMLDDAARVMERAATSAAIIKRVVADIKTRMEGGQMAGTMLPGMTFSFKGHAVKGKSAGKDIETTVPDFIFMTADVNAMEHIAEIMSIHELDSRPSVSAGRTKTVKNELSLDDLLSAGNDDTLTALFNSAVSDTRSKIESDRKRGEQLKQSRSKKTKTPDIKTPDVDNEDSENEDSDLLD